jgi:hypothetical protein
MALNPATLSTAIKSAVLADVNVRDNASLKTLCDAIAQAVVAHIAANAVVTVAAGIPIAGTGGGAAPVAGATTAPGVGVIT